MIESSQQIGVWNEIENKKIIAVALCIVLSMPLTSCGKAPASESSVPSNSNSIIKWFDCLNGDEML